MQKSVVTVLLRIGGNAIAKTAGKPARVVGQGRCRLDQSGAMALLRDLPRGLQDDERDAVEGRRE